MGLFSTDCRFGYFRHRLEKKKKNSPVFRRSLWKQEDENHRRGLSLSLNDVCAYFLGNDEASSFGKILTTAKIKKDQKEKERRGTKFLLGSKEEEGEEEVEKGPSKSRDSLEALRYNRKAWSRVLR